MNRIRIAQRGLRFYWKTHLATGLAVLVASAVLAGALAVGDSIRATLSRRTAMCLGKIQATVSRPGLFRADLAARMEDKLAPQRGRTTPANESRIVVAPILQITGFAENSDASVRVGNVQIIGVDERFQEMGPGTAEDITSGPNNAVAVSRALAQRLNLKVGQDIVVRMRDAGGMPAEAVLTPEEQKHISLRRTVLRIAEDEQFGGFDLYSRPDGGLNVFMPLGELNAAMGKKGNWLRANTLLFAGAAGTSGIGQTLSSVWQPEDAELEVHIVDWPRALEVRSRDVFMPDTIAQQIQKNVPGGQGILTYFVNEFRRGEKSVPYSFICAVEGGTDEGSFTTLAQNEMVINEWLAEQLGASEGDKVEIRYFVPSQGKKLSEETATFTVKAVVPMMGAGADETLMPAIETMADARNCRDWKSGIPINLSKIRPEDERYWQKYKGAPKAFISMKSAKLLWSSRFGTLTAIRFSVNDYDVRSLRSKILSAIEPWQAGFVVSEVRQAGQRGARATTDFGGLATGLSLFLIAAAMILAGLVWSFGLRRRAGQVGILSAMGFGAGQIGWIFLLEEGPVIMAASILGVPVGIIYTKLILAGLNSIWAGAAGGIKIIFALRWQTAILAAGISICTTLVVWLFRIRNLWKRPAVELLDRTEEIFLPGGRIRLSLVAAGVVGFAAAGLGAYGTQVSAQQAAEIFFSSGMMILIAMGLFLSAGLSWLAVRHGSPQGVRAAGVSKSIRMLVLKNAAWRRGRSVAVSMTLAMGVFVVLATGVFQQAGPQDPTEKNSGTGGFTLWAQSSVGLVNDLNDKTFLRDIGISSGQLQHFNAVPLRLLSAQDASCLNIARVQQPSLWGVRAEGLAGRFRFKKVFDKRAPANPWEWLNLNLGQEVVPAIGDWATVYWGLHKDIGDELDYTDQSGRIFRLKIVALLDDSILQGGLLISERQFLKRFENTSGWNVFLIDMPLQSAESISEKLTQSLTAYGFEVQTTAEKLARFHQVENTYISIFMVLGSLGLILGAIGLGLVVLLNVLDRAGQLAMMRATGFEKKTLGRMLFLEHAGLLTAGLVFGVISAAVAAGPQLLQISHLPWKIITGLIAVMWASGLLWVCIAAAAAMRGDLLEPLRKE